MIAPLEEPRSLVFPTRIVAVHELRGRLLVLTARRTYIFTTWPRTWRERVACRVMLWLGERIDAPWIEWPISWRSVWAWWWGRWLGAGGS